MVNCDYCGKEIKRKVFCSPSHKVMFHRKGKATVIVGALNTKEEVKEVLPEPFPEKFSPPPFTEVPVPEKVPESVPEKTIGRQLWEDTFSDTKKEGYHFVEAFNKYVKD